MGYNTVAFMLNDQSYEIEQRSVDVLAAIKRGLASGMGAEVGQALRVLPSVHADGNQLIMAGGNRITPLATLYYCDHTEEALLKALADKLGYTLTKKRKRPTPTDR